MRTLQYVDIGSVLKELPLNKPMSQITVLTMRHQVEKIKLAHDKYTTICELGNTLHHIAIWLNVLSNVGVITPNLYAVIILLLGQQYDLYILLHCLIWVTYRMFNLLIVVSVLTFTAKEVS